MNRYVSLYRWQLIGISLLVLLALLFMFFVQAPSLTVPQIQRPAAGEAAPVAAEVELPAGIHPADRKFYGNGYAIYRDATGSSYTLDSVHPADRKFFTYGYGSGAAQEATSSVQNADLTGTWLVTPAIESGGGAGITFKSLLTFTQDGILIQSSQGDSACCPARSAGHGVWQKTGDDAYAITFVMLEYRTPAALEAIVTANLTANLDESGNYLSGTLQGSAVDPEGNTLWSNAGSFQGQRILIEPVE